MDFSRCIISNGIGYSTFYLVPVFILIELESVGGGGGSFFIPFIEQYHFSVLMLIPGLSTGGGGGFLEYMQLI